MAILRLQVKVNRQVHTQAAKDDEEMPDNVNVWDAFLQVEHGTTSVS